MPGQMVLQPQHSIGKQHRHHAENQDGDAILLPILLRLRIDAKQPVKQPLHRPEQRIEKCLAVCVQHAAQINAQRLGNRQQHRYVQHKLYPSSAVHIRLFTC